MTWLTSWMVDTATIGRVTVRDQSGGVARLATREIKCRIETDVRIVVDQSGNEKQTENKIGTEATIDVDEYVLREGGDEDNPKDFRPILQAKSARSKNGRRLKLTEFWV